MGYVKILARLNENFLGMVDFRNYITTESDRGNKTPSLVENNVGKVGNKAR